METKSNSEINQIGKKSTKSKIKPINFLIGFIAISSIFAFIIGGIFLGHEKNKNKNKLTNNKTVENSTEIPNDPSDWHYFKIESVEMQVKLSERLIKKGDWREQIINGNKGNLMCFSYDKSENNCFGDEIKIGGSSYNFETDRSLTFTDLQGFENKYGNYFSKGPNNQMFSLKDIRMRQFENENGVEIIKVLGANSNGIPISGTPGEGYVGALINSKSQKYPGFAIQMKINSEMSELEFDQILKNIKFSN